MKDLIETVIVLETDVIMRAISQVREHKGQAGRWWCSAREDPGDSSQTPKLYTTLWKTGTTWTLTYLQKKDRNPVVPSVTLSSLWEEEEAGYQVDWQQWGLTSDLLSAIIRSRPDRCSWLIKSCGDGGLCFDSEVRESFVLRTDINAPSATRATWFSSVRLWWTKCVWFI